MKKIVILLLLFIGINSVAFDSKEEVQYYNDLVEQFKKIDSESNGQLSKFYAEFQTKELKKYSPNITDEELNKFYDSAIKTAPEYAASSAIMESKHSTRIKNNNNGYFSIKNNNEK